MSTQLLSASTFELSFDLNLKIGFSCPSRACRDFVIDICHDKNGFGPQIAVYTSRADEREGNQIVLDVWDRESFRTAYRWARTWRTGGIGNRLFPHMGDAA